MADIKWKTRNRGTVTTSQGIMNVEIKKPFKGALSWSLFINDDKKDSSCDVIYLREMAKEYVRWWK